ncbi:hypothetical protein ABER68_14455 [Paenibacillus alvei]
MDIPAEIKHIALDPKEGKLEVYDTESFQVNRPFMHEAAYYHGLNTLYPWHPDEQKACITAIFNLWKEKRTEIEAAIQKKDKDVTVRTVKTGSVFSLNVCTGRMTVLFIWKRALLQTSCRLSPLMQKRGLPLFYQDLEATIPTASWMSCLKNWKNSLR